ncbi:NACHT domain-containing protein [Kordia sp.]|uniref:NACHT domain-containing protein n=1 Tax=Kordia sp. TaxID=1965332 RepID=UPI003B59ED5C
MSGTIILKKPVSFYNQKLKIKKGFFLHLGKAVISLKTGNVPVAVKDVLGAISSLKFTETTEEKAYLLILRTLGRTCFSIIKEHHVLFSETSLAKKVSLEYDVDEKLENLNIEIDVSFFENPQGQDFLEAFITLFEEWLIASGIQKIRAENLTLSFARKFAIELMAEWHSNEDFYLSISEFLNSPFKNYNEERRKKELYLNKLTKYYTSVVPGDETGMTLANLYVEPGFKIFRECLDKDTQNRREEKSESFWKLDQYDNIHKFIYDFVDYKIENLYELESKTAKCLLVLGYPGQGKTSLCSKILYDLIEIKQQLNTNYYLIKLRDISDTKELINNPIKAITNFLSEREKQSFDATENNLVLLDGLDELYMKDGLSNNDIKEFCRELGHLSTDSLANTKFIVTSRYGYVNIEALKKNQHIVVTLDEFDESRQKIWVENYMKFYPKSNLTPEKIDHINENIEHVAELIRQPILLHLVSKVDIDYEKLSNRTAIYNQLFNSLIERKWDKTGQIDNLEGLTKVSLRNYIRDIALAIFQSDFEYIRKRDLENLPATQTFLNKLKTKNIESSLKSIMISFYFQEVQKDATDTKAEDHNTNYAIEFLHKSLQEYLVAEKIWYGFLELVEKRSNGEYFISNWEDALFHISKLLSSKLISKEVTDYLKELIKNHEDTDQKEELKKRMQFFFEDFLEISFYNPIKDTTNTIESSLHIFYGFWTVLAEVNMEENLIPEASQDTFVKFLSWATFNNVLSFNLSHQEISYIIFKNTDLTDSILKSMQLNDISFNRILFRGSHIINISFDKSSFLHCDFEHSYISNCSFHVIQMYQCDFLEAYIRECVLTDMFFYTSLFENTIFVDCDFQNVTMESIENLKGCGEITNPKNLDPKIRAALPEHIFKEDEPKS